MGVDTTVVNRMVEVGLVVLKVTMLKSGIDETLGTLEDRVSTSWTSWIRVTR